MSGNDEMQFSVFLMQLLAESWHKKQFEVYRILNETKALDDYVIKNYETLHAMDRNALVESVSDFVREKGVSL